MQQRKITENQLYCLAKKSVYVIDKMHDDNKEYELNSSRNTNRGEKMYND